MFSKQMRPELGKGACLGISSHKDTHIPKHSQELSKDTAAKLHAAQAWLLRKPPPAPGNEVKVFRVFHNPHCFSQMG